MPLRPGHGDQTVNQQLRPFNPPQPPQPRHSAAAAEAGGEGGGGPTQLGGRDRGRGSVLRAYGTTCIGLTDSDLALALAGCAVALVRAAGTSVRGAGSASLAVTLEGAAGRPAYWYSAPPARASAQQSPQHW